MHTCSAAGPIITTYTRQRTESICRWGRIEPQFYGAFVAKLGLDLHRFLPAGYPNENCATVAHDWPALKAELTAIFKTRTRDAWIALFEDSDVCVTPVLTLAEAMEHPHNRARESFIEIQACGSKRLPRDSIVRSRPNPRRLRISAPTPTRSRKSGAWSRL